jgi:hypothetical protein
MANGLFGAQPEMPIDTCRPADRLLRIGDLQAGLETGCDPPMDMWTTQER